VIPVPWGNAAQQRFARPQVEVSLMLMCRHILCALPAHSVRRLLLEEEVSLQGPAIRVGKESFLAWNLAERLGMAPTQGAWALVDVPAGATLLTMALRITKCVSVRPTPPLVALPPGIFVLRSEAIRGGFVPGPDAPPETWGLALDPTHLWSAAELSTSHSLLRSQASWK
jgi:hypothetical protein